MESHHLAQCERHAHDTLGSEPTGALIQYSSNATVGDRSSSPLSGNQSSNQEDINRPAPVNNGSSSEVYHQKRRSAFYNPSWRKTAKENKTVQNAKPLHLLTVHFNRLLTKCNPKFPYDPSRKPQRVLTKPSNPCKNNGYDNENSDYILYVNALLGDKNRPVRYMVLDMLGSGTFGQVAKCRNMSTGELVGVKIIKNKPAYLKQSLIEVEILKHLDHEWYTPGDRHILRLLDNFEYHNHLCLVFELLSVNLYDLMKQNKFKGLSTNLVRIFAAQILDALIVLQEASIIHCDLKPENILLKSLEAPEIKVIDFGSACRLSQQLYTYIQSRFYRSPEVLLGADYTYAIDMWSFGLAELFLGLPLFPGSSEYDQLSRIMDTCGSPPVYLIEQGRKGRQFFNRIESDHGFHATYTLKSRHQYSLEQQKIEKRGKQYLATTNLSELILTYPMPRKHMSQEEQDKEMDLRHSLVDFLEKVLQTDPLRRLSPREAKAHPFISGGQAICLPSTKAHDSTDIKSAAAAAATAAGRETDMSNCCICSVDFQPEHNDSCKAHESGLPNITTPPLSPVEKKERSSISCMSTAIGLVARSNISSTSSATVTPRNSTSVIGFTDENTMTLRHRLQPRSRPLSIISPSHD